MFVEVLLITLAFVLYSIAIWSERLKKQGLLLWMVVIFFIGLVCDGIGTGSMMINAKSRNLNFHGACGYAALAIMLLHFIWAFGAIIWHGKAERYFSRCSIYAWIIWLIAFISGGVGSMVH